MTISRSNFFSSLTPRAVKGITTAYFRSRPNRPSSQEKFLFSHLLQSSSTAFGKEHDFISIETIEDFQEHIPLQNYESAQPRIERAMQGEKNVLVRGTTDRFATSSGTTGASKYIPVTKESLRKNHYRGGLDLMMHYARNNPTTTLRK